MKSTDFWGIWEGTTLRILKARCPGCRWTWTLSGEKWKDVMDTQMVRFDPMRAPVGRTPVSSMRGVPL